MKAVVPETHSPQLRNTTVTIVLFFQLWGQATIPGRGKGVFLFFFPSIVKTLQVFAYTCQKVPLRHSKLCYLNSECRTIHVEDRNQDCIAIPRLRVRQVGRYYDSSAPGPLSPRACRVTADVIKGPCRCASGLKVN